MLADMEENRMRVVIRDSLAEESLQARAARLEVVRAGLAELEMCGATAKELDAIRRQ